MALQKAFTLANGLTAPNAYSVIMIAQRNKIDNRIEAHVHVYVDVEHRQNTKETNPPIHTILHVIEGDELASLEPDALVANGISLEEAIYNHVKANRSEYADAVDI